MKIATVNMQELFKQYYRTTEAQKKINVERARVQKDINERFTRIREIEGNLANLKKQLDDLALGEQKKQAILKDMQAQNQDGVALDRERREFLQSRDRSPQ